MGFSSRKRAPSFAEQRIQPLPFLHQPPQPHLAQGISDPLIGSLRIQETHIVPQRSIEDMRSLRDVCHMGMPIGTLQRFRLRAVHADAATGRVSEASQDIQKR